VRRAIAAIAACGLLALAGCSARDAVPAEDGSPPTVTVVQPRRGDVVRAITLPGDLVALNQSALYAKVTGYLRTIAVDKGDWVKKGQVLAEIEVPELEQKTKRARASLDVRRVTYQRLRDVWQTDRRLVAREDVDVAQGAFQEAAAKVEELEALVGYTRIVAPFDGVVTARYVDPGALIQGHAAGSEEGGGGAGEKASARPVVTVADIDTLRVYVYVPEEETSAIRRGLSATLRLREFPGHEFTGQVARFATALDLSTRTMLTEVDLDNREHVLYPGMYADVTLELDRHHDALTLPPAALGHANEQTFILAVKDGRLQRVPVVVGLENADQVEITSGLSGDEQVVSPVGPAFTAGERVRVAEAEQAPLASIR
jgi:membrane fusion protein, multidrug efflux system